MTLSRFAYAAPRTIKEACRLLEEKGDDACLLAGGTDLMVKIGHGRARPGTVIGLKRIAGLDRISFDRKKGLTIGATALLADVAAHPAVLKTYPAVAHAAGETANVQIRNMGTVAGNLCNAAPSADNAPTLLAMGAVVTLVSAKGERRLPLDQFFKGPGMTAILPGEIMTAIFVPLPPPGSGTSYQHISARGKVDISAVGVGVMVTMKGRKCLETRIFLGAVGPTPLRAVRAEKTLCGERVTPALMDAAGLAAAKEARPISDVRASAAYRRKMVAVLTRRAVAEAVDRASGKRR
ncbi:MAG: xanthine dehydrogenase family protein subunit M [Deltaproteobacteria bacterium]|nr:MAG: xanthine dehydrogenase family protein subunit M [Deltaproteobacteria bacterium]